MRFLVLPEFAAGSLAEPAGWFFWFCGAELDEEPVVEPVAGSSFSFSM